MIDVLCVFMCVSEVEVEDRRSGVGEKEEAEGRRGIDIAQESGGPGERGERRRSGW